MNAKSYSVRESTISKLLICVALFFHFLLINRNIDPLHDGIFFSYGLAVSDGFAMHRDIQAAYGPVVPWIISVAIGVFGEYIIIPRIIGFVFLVAITLIFYSMMSECIGRLKSSLVVILWLVVQSGISEVTSIRWPYGGGIWPTTFAILAHVILFHKLIKHLSIKKSEFSRLYFANFFFSGLMIAIAGFSRLQGLATLLVSACVVLYLYMKRSIEKKVFLLISAGATVGLVFSLSILLIQNSLQPFLEQNIFWAFRFAGSYMGGSAVSIGWLKSLVMSSGFGVATAIAIMAIFAMATNLSLYYRASAVFSIAITLTFFVMYFRYYKLPSDLNRAVDLYLIKILQSFANTFIWPLGLTFFVVIALVIWKISKKLARNESVSDEVNPLSITALILGLASVTHLYVNFGYIWNIVPITLPAALILNSQFSLLDKFFMRFKVAIMEYISLGIAIFTLVFLSGMFQATNSNNHRFFYGTIGNVDYNKNLDKILGIVQKGVQHQRNLFIGCENFFLLESLDTYSYKLKTEVLSRPEQNSLSFAKLIDRNSRVQSIVMCSSENNKTTFDELILLGWKVSQYVNLEGSENLAIMKR